MWNCELLAFLTENRLSGGIYSIRQIAQSGLEVLFHIGQRHQCDVGRQFIRRLPLIGHGRHGNCGAHQDHLPELAE